MNVRELLVDALRIKGYDGLFSIAGQCACAPPDLMPCGEASTTCEAGYKAPCDGSCDAGSCDFHIVARKRKAKP